MRKTYYILIYILIMMVLMPGAMAQTRETPPLAIHNAVTYLNGLRQNPAKYQGEISGDISWAEKHKALTTSFSIKKHLGKLLVDIRKRGDINLDQETIDNAVKSIMKTEGSRIVEIIIYEQKGIEGQRLMQEILSHGDWAKMMLGFGDTYSKFRKICYVVYPAKTKGNYYWIIALADRTRYNN